MLVAERVEGRVDELAVRLGPLQRLQLGDALLVVHARCLHGVHALGLDPIELAAKDHVGVLEDRLDQAQHVERVALALLVQHLQRVEEIERQRLVERMKLVALVNDPNSVRRFLGHLGLSAEPPPLGPARGPPFARGPERRLRPSPQAEMFDEG